jgi:hypothetical protein
VITEVFANVFFNVFCTSRFVKCCSVSLGVLLKTDKEKIIIKQKNYYFLAEILLCAKTINSLFDVTLESFDSAEIRELIG